MDASGSDNNNANNTILVLRANTRTMISNLLNPHKFLKTEKGLPRDWQGLAELCGIPGELLSSFINDHDPTAKVLKLWQEQGKAEATVDKLLTYLEQLDRFDIVDDILPLIAEDIEYHKDQPPSGKTIKPFDLEADKFILTRDDVVRINEGLEPQRYDAFVLFADEDIDFATKLIGVMEKEYNLKLCVKERDLVVGGSEHGAMIKLITERCGRLVVIISDEFFKSSANEFFYNLAQSVAIGQRERKIIPCIYKDYTYIPPEVSYYFKLDFRKAGQFWNCWDKLYESIKIPDSKPVTKLSLPENSLFSRTDNNSESKISSTVSRSVSNPNNILSLNDLKPALHKDSAKLPQNISHSVKFSNSMSNLPNTEVPEDNMAASTSANSLGKYEDKGVKKSLSIYRKFKNLGSLFSKSEKQQSDEQQINIENKRNGKIESDKIGDGNKNNENVMEVKEIKSNGKEIKEDQKGKKKKVFTLKRNKKKMAVLTDT